MRSRLYVKEAGAVDTAAKFMRDKVDDLWNSRVMDTLKNIRLFGNSGPNPWADTLARMNKEEAFKAFRRYFDVRQLSPSAREELMGMLKPSANSFEDMAEIAKKFNLVDNSTLRNFGMNAVDFLQYINPARMFVGSDKSRAQAMHDLWEGGLFGKGSTLRKALTPGDALFKNMQKYKDILAGKENMPGLLEVSKDIVGTGGAIAKPLLAGGAIFPIASIAHRINHKDKYDEPAIRGALRDAGWYAGMTMGIPGGVLGAKVMSGAGKRVGDMLGNALAVGTDAYGKKARRVAERLQQAMPESNTPREYTNSEERLLAADHAFTPDHSVDYPQPDYAATSSPQEAPSSETSNAVYQGYVPEEDLIRFY